MDEIIIWQAQTGLSSVSAVFRGDDIICRKEIQYFNDDVRFDFQDRELDIQASVCHPTITQLKNFTDDLVSKQLIVEMDFIPSGPLYELLHRVRDPATPVIGFDQAQRHIIA
jgi:hypothetical protein